MFWRKLSNFTQLGPVRGTKWCKEKMRWRLHYVWEECPRCFASESALNATTLRLWSDSGGEHVPSTPFDHLGAWHSAEAKSFLHNVSLDNVGHISHTGLRETNEDSYKLVELEPDLYYFAVFDGHGGSAAVDFVSEHLHECVKHFYSHDKIWRVC